MGDERVSVGTTSGVFEHWRVDLDKAVGVHEITRGLPELAATDQAFAHFGIDVHVDIAAAVALFFVAEAIVARQWAQGFGQKSHLIGKN